MASGADGSDGTSGGGKPPSDSPPVCFGDPVDQISVRVTGGVAHITIIGSPTGKTLVSCMRFVFDKGIMLPRMPTLVDLTAFESEIDWGALQTIAAMTEIPPYLDLSSRVAYVSQGRFMWVLIKLLGHIFTSSEHRLFVTPDEALAWLTPTARSS
jgi:hypothetical protein